MNEQINAVAQEAAEMAEKANVRSNNGFWFGVGCFVAGVILTIATPKAVSAIKKHSKKASALDDEAFETTGDDVDVVED